MRKIVATVIVHGRPLILGVVLIDDWRGWASLEGEQFAVRRSGKVWRVI